MRFAHSVANRALYMDEGGIYEQGSPEQIFDHPQREKTRQLIKYLKTLRCTIDTLVFSCLAVPWRSGCPRYPR